jgi:hypothetical protein
MWQKGQSGNPNGRPHKQCGLTDELYRQLKRKWEPVGTTNKELLVQQLICRGLTGNVRALEVILERADGKVPTPVEHTGQEGQAIMVKFVTGKDGE